MGGSGSISCLGRGPVGFIRWPIGDVFYEKLCGDSKAYPYKGREDVVSNHFVYSRYCCFDQSSAYSLSWGRSDYSKFGGCNRFPIGSGGAGVVPDIGQGNVWQMGGSQGREGIEKGDYIWCGAGGLTGS